MILSILVWELDAGNAKNWLLRITISVSGGEVRGCLVKGVGSWNRTMISWLQELPKSARIEGWNLEWM
jgi:hypothetical protein